MNKRFSLEIKVYISELRQKVLKPLLKIPQFDISRFPCKSFQSARTFRASEIARRGGFYGDTYRLSMMKSSTGDSGKMKTQEQFHAVPHFSGCKERKIGSMVLQLHPAKIFP